MASKTGFERTPLDEIAKVSLKKLDHFKGRILLIVERHDDRRVMFSQIAALLEAGGVRYNARYSHNSIRVDDCGELLILTKLEIENDRHRGHHFKAILSTVYFDPDTGMTLESRIR